MFQYFPFFYSIHPSSKSNVWSSKGSYILFGPSIVNIARYIVHFARVDSVAGSYPVTQVCAVLSDYKTLGLTSDPGSTRIRKLSGAECGDFRLRD